MFKLYFSNNSFTFLLDTGYITSIICHSLLLFIQFWRIINISQPLSTPPPPHFIIRLVHLKTRTESSDHVVPLSQQLSSTNQSISQIPLFNQSIRFLSSINQGPPSRWWLAAMNRQHSLSLDLRQTVFSPSLHAICPCASLSTSCSASFECSCLYDFIYFF